MKLWTKAVDWEADVLHSISLPEAGLDEVLDFVAYNLCISDLL